MPTPTKTSSYPSDWQLTEEELKKFEDGCIEGLRTTNGDTAPVTLTVRQLILLLENYKK